MGRSVAVGGKSNGFASVSGAAGKGLWISSFVGEAFVVAASDTVSRGDAGRKRTTTMPNAITTQRVAAAATASRGQRERQPPTGTGARAWPQSGQTVARLLSLIQCLPQGQTRR